jgi:hypothetical protein
MKFGHILRFNVVVSAAEKQQQLKSVAEEHE